MNPCRDFRQRLEAALVGELRGAPVAWHSHLSACAACRDLFAAEEALDELLACLPHPELPVALARRVLLRLQRDQRLDAALDRALGAEAPPAGLAARVLAGVQAKSAPSLDDLLARLPEPSVPAGLAERIVAQVQHAQPALRPVAARTPLLRLGLAAAASLLAAFIGYRLVGDNAEPPQGPAIVDVPRQSPDAAEPSIVPIVPDAELLASLELLEEWELLMAQDVDLALGSLDDSDAELLLLDALVASEEEEG